RAGLAGRRAGRGVDRVTARDLSAAAAFAVDHLEARGAVRVARSNDDVLAGGVVCKPEALHRGAVEQAHLAIFARVVAEQRRGVGDVDHVVHRVVVAAGDVTEAVGERALAAAARTPER